MHFPLFCLLSIATFPLPHNGSLHSLLCTFLCIFDPFPLTLQLSEHMPKPHFVLKKNITFGSPNNAEKAFNPSPFILLMRKLRYKDMNVRRYQLNLQETYVALSSLQSTFTYIIGLYPPKTPLQKTVFIIHTYR